MVMMLLMLLLVVFVAGLIGGMANAVLTDNGFWLPKSEMVGDRKIWRPGFLANAAIGGVAASISWGLYGPFAATFLIGNTPVGNDAEANIGLSLSSFVGAILVGIGGAKWLTNEVDKRVFQAAASSAAAAPADAKMSTKIAVATPMDALKISQGIAP